MTIYTLHIGTKQQRPSMQQEINEETNLHTHTHPQSSHPKPFSFF